MKIDKVERDLKLHEGIEIDGFLFSAKRAYEFTNKMNTLINLHEKSLKWGNMEGDTVEMTIEEAKKIARVLVFAGESVYLES